MGYFIFAAAVLIVGFLLQPALHREVRQALARRRLRRRQAELAAAYARFAQGVGEQLIPAMTRLADAGTKAVPAFEKFGEALRDAGQEVKR